MAMSTEKKVGIFFLLAIIALGIMIELVEDWKPFQTQHDYQTYFSAAVGIKIGDPVRMAGVEVGKIRDIVIDDSKVRIDFYVSEDTVLREDTVAEIRQTNLLGGQFLGLDFGSPGSAQIPPGTTVPSKEGANIDQLITNLDRNQQRVLGALGEMIEESRDQFRDSLAQIESIVRKIDQGDGTIGKLINDPTLYNDLQGAVVNLRSTLEKIEHGEGTLGRLMQDGSLYDEARATMANLNEITGTIKQGQGTLGKLFTEDELYRDASATLANLREISTKANQGSGTLGKLINDDNLYLEVSQTMQRINSIAAKIDEGQGTIGRLINEDDLYREAKTTLHKVEKTTDGLSDTGPLSALGVVLGTLF